MRHQRTKGHRSIFVAPAWEQRKTWLTWQENLCGRGSRIFCLTKPQEQESTATCCQKTTGKTLGALDGSDKKEPFQSFADFAGYDANAAANAAPRPAPTDTRSSRPDHDACEQVATLESACTDRIAAYDFQMTEESSRDIKGMQHAVNYCIC